MDLHGGRVPHPLPIACPPPSRQAHDLGAPLPGVGRVMCSFTADGAYLWLHHPQGGCAAVRCFALRWEGGGTQGAGTLGMKPRDESSVYWGADNAHVLPHG